jgi:hypothetical protein
VYRLLIINGYGSYLTPEFDLFYKENLIITLCIPPYSLHLLQPLDVGCFAGLKKLYGGEVERLMQAGVNHIDKDDFLNSYKTAHTQAFNSRNIYSNFTAAGLVPYSPERVLSRLNVELRTPTPPLAQDKDQGSQTPWAPETPYNVVQLDL